MKLQLTIVGLLLSFGQLLNSQNPNLQLTEFEKATIVYEQETEQANIFIKSLITAYIKDYGKSLAQYIDEERDIRMINRKEKSRKHTIMQGEELISIDLDKMTGTTGRNLAKDFLGNMDNKQANQFGTEIMKMANAERKEDGTMNIAGVTCQRYIITSNMMGIETKTIECKYKGYNMYEESSGMGVKTKKIVTSFKEGDSGPDSAWKPEPGAKLKKVSW